ncbi:hypothetical protein [Chitinophaga pinensis]|uniref:Uncharacterized protein n=1 Tax=Chitinophaga pinensis TaxID=79329 RepID=A0A5C6LND7_9BACT|nr:hypothetical protein [Chitinophaga pinensis]TWV98662.1 hypothetical protein FEF09_20490 [Chitinophaga pinensis]
MIKATDNKSKTAKTRQQPEGGSFFNKDKGAGSAFLGETAASEEPFFVQRKLTIGKPDDHYEKQADQIADKVVQRMSQPAPVQTKAATPSPVSTVPAGSVPASAAQPAGVQMKEQEKKEEDIQTDEKKLQRKPIFDSMGDPPDDIQKKRQRRHPRQMRRQMQRGIVAIILNSVCRVLKVLVRHWLQKRVLQWNQRLVQTSVVYVYIREGRQQS